MKHLTYRIALIFAIMGLSCANAFAQQVKGTVKDSAGEPVIGAAVMVEGTSIGTTVDLDGNFVLNEDLGSDVILVVTSIGYKTARVPVGGGIVNVILEEDSELLDEVVMIGYGVQKKAVVSAAISTVGDEMLEKVAAVRVDDALKGLTPGVNVTSTSGQPGAGSQIRIRGIGTIGDSAPLYVIDEDKVREMCRTYKNAVKKKDAEPKKPKNYERKRLRLKKGNKTRINHRLNSTNLNVELTDTAGNVVPVKVKTVDANSITITSKEDLNNLTLKITTIVKKEGPMTAVKDYSIRFLTMIRNISVNYRHSDALEVNGYRPLSGFLGQDHSNPGYDFTFGFFNAEKFLQRAYREDSLLIVNENITNPLIHSITQNLTVKSLVEPIPGLKIDLNASWYKNHQTDIYYMYGYDSDWNSQDIAGSFSRTCLPIRTAFKDNTHNSEVFDEFLKNRDIIQSRIYNEVGTLIYTSKGSGALPKNLLWDGNNNDGKKVPDGSYSAKLDVVFENGTPSSAKTGLFIIDTVAPQIKIQAVSDVFSPNADSRIDTFEVLQAGSEELSWDEYIYDDAGNVMFHKFYENSKPTPKESWNGKDMNGNLAKNGFYKYVITGRDIAENESTASIERFELKNIYTSAFLTLSEEMMAPKGKSPYDVIEIIPMVGVKEDISAYKVEILNESKEIVRVFQGEKVLPEKFTWDGMKTDGTQAVDGLYTAKMTVVYRFGNMPTVETPVFKVDSTAPEIKLTYEPEYFSPDNDNVDDELNIQIDSDDLTGIKEWKIVVIDPQSGKEFTSFSGKGKPASTIKWNGQNENGEIVESAEDYPVKVYAEDLVGNVLEMNASPIMVDILVIKEADGRLKIKISNIEFKPDSSQMVDSAKNVKVLNMLAKALKKYGSYKITIEGHANKFREKIDENRARALSDQRSQAIAAKLKKLGINGGRMTTVGRGVDMPLVPFGPEATKEQLAKNRRVEFYLEK